MKNLILFYLLLTCFLIGSCKNNKSVKEVEIAETPISIENYVALYQQDTIDLKINTLKNGKITGDMEMKIFNMPKKIGKIAGEFSGDTLFASYTFYQGEYIKKTYKNPMAFLKKGEELILGNGKIETTMGASYFIKGEPIDFEQVKYKFNKVESNDK